MQEETKKKLNVLTGMQTHKLYAWMETEGAAIDYSAHLDAVAAMASDELDFTVTSKNIYTAANALGLIQAKKKAAAVPQEPATAPACNIDITAALRTITENNTTLARAIIHLSHVIGVTPEYGLAVIAGTGIKK